MLDHWSFSRITQYFTCARCYWMRYIGKVEMDIKPFYNDARICGQAMHLCAQESVDTGVEFYKSKFEFLNQRHWNEILKFKAFGKPLNEMFKFHQHEVKLTSDDGFLGFIDDYDGETNTIVDFKYSNSITHYLASPQIHLYKYYAEQKGMKVDNLAYVFIPKIGIRQKKTETPEEFRERLIDKISESNIQYVPVKYDYMKVYNFLKDKDYVIDITENHPEEIEYYPCDPDRKFCRNCDYLFFCERQGYSNEVEPEINMEEYEEYEKRLLEEEELLFE